MLAGGLYRRILTEIVSTVFTHDRGQDSTTLGLIRCLLYGKQEQFNLMELLFTNSDILPPNADELNLIHRAFLALS